MSIILALVQFDKTTASLVAVALFLITIFMASRRWIGAKTTIILLLFSIIIGLVITIQHPYQPPASQISYSFQKEDKADREFRLQLLKAIEELKREMASQRESLSSLKNHIHDISNTVEAQEQKLQALMKDFELRQSDSEPTSLKGESSVDSQLEEDGKEGVEPLNLKTAVARALQT